MRDWIFENEPGDWGIVAPTFGDARDKCVEGISGILRACGGLVGNGGLVAKWNRSVGELEMVNGSKVYLDGADDGALRIQGQNLRGAWCDEIGLWRRSYAALSWDESLGFAVRLAPSRIVATGTPKGGHPLVTELCADDEVPITVLRTLDNAPNLDKRRVERLIRKWQGTRLGRQELEGELLDDVVGALWTHDRIENLRVRQAQGKVDSPDAGFVHPQRIVVGIDPSGSPDEDSGAAECGIIAVALEPTGLHEVPHGYVVADASLQASPRKWAEQAVGLYNDLGADRIVAERNFGGEMVRTVIETVDPKVPVTLVTASRGKQVRAEPIAALYEQGRVHHAGVFPELEDQMCSWTPEDPVSPDRMDALVWALTDLMLGRHDVSESDYRKQSEPARVRRGDLVLVGDRYVDR